ncbi:MAG: hypothetical protein UR82_C0041G0001, partial [Candidatus Moranbacteria bacterium GW2011_GWF1_35_5]
EEERSVVRQWESTAVDRIAVVDKDGNIEMRIIDNVFSTDATRQDVSYYISNPNVCLNYLAGRIGVEEVMAAAEETQKQIDLQQRCTHLEHEAKYLQEMLDRAEATNSSLSKELELSVINEYGLKEEKSRLIEAHETKCASLQKDMRDWKEAATQLRDAVNSNWFMRAYDCVGGGNIYMFETKKTRIKEALKLFPDKSLNDHV